jgi:23S rRNA pseudouridine2457 synthase
MHQSFTGCHPFAVVPALRSVVLAYLVRLHSLYFCAHIATMSLILFNKPYLVLCQFSSDVQRKTLADYLDQPAIYPAGRLDTDSEGLMLLTDDGKLQQAISHPARKQPKTYLVQVEGIAGRNALKQLEAGITLNDFTTLPCKAVQVMPPDWLWLRDPPIRERTAVPTSWLALTITEGKNRQVRRMTAAVGLPTLRLIRTAIGPFSLASHPLLPGEWETVNPALLN